MINTNKEIENQDDCETLENIKLLVELATEMKKFLDHASANLQEVIERRLVQIDERSRNHYWTIPKK